MRRNHKESVLLAALLALVMLLSSFPMVYAHAATAEVSASCAEAETESIAEAVVPSEEDAPTEEDVPAEENGLAEVPEEEAEPGEEADEETSEDTFFEFDDGDCGSVSDELLEIFNNPDAYEKAEFDGSVEIELKNGEICYDRDVTLVARVSGADMDYYLVWEANDGDGWYAIASGEEYTFLLTPDIANREYRVVLFKIC